MKFKLTVLTLLVVGLVLGLSSVAFGDVVMSLKALNNDTYTLDDNNVVFGEIPIMRVSLTNTEAASVTVTTLSITNSANVVTGDRFNIRVWNDVNDNGLLDAADVALAAAQAGAGAAGAANAIDITDTAIATGDSLNLLITGAKLGTAIAGTEIFEVILNEAVPAVTFLAALTGSLADNGVAALNPGTDINVPHIAIAAGVGSITAAAHPVAVAVGNMPNKKLGVVVGAFKLTGDDAAISHVLDRITLAETGSADALDFNNVKIYIDVDDNGAVGDNDAMLTLDTTTFVATHVLTHPVFIFNQSSVNFLIVADGTGLASDGDILVTQMTAAATFADGAAGLAVTNDIASAAQTMKALQAAWETVDVQGPPFGRPNGSLDAIKVSFYTGGTQAGAVVTGGTAVDVADVKFAAEIPQATTKWDVIGPGAYNHVESYSATYNSDVADNNYFYIMIDEDAASQTDHLPTLTYTMGATQVVDATTGNYALVVFGATAAIDKAPPAPMSVTTVDALGNGKIESVWVQFSEALTGTSTTTGEGFSVVDGFVITGGAGSAAIAGGNLWKIEVTEGDDYNTGATPNYTYSSVSGSLQDGPGNDVLSFNYNGVPIIDGAVPTLVKITTLDNDADGRFDNLELLFSEIVVLDVDHPDSTASILTDNTGTSGFTFGTAHNGAYSFTVSGNVGLGTNTLTFPVNEVGALDTAVSPTLLYVNGGVNNVLTDDAPTPNELATSNEFTSVTSAALVVGADEIWVKDAISPKIISAVTLDGSVQGAQNGKLDALLLTFSEPMGPISSTYSSLVIGGIAIEADSTVITGVNVLVGLVEDAYNTGLEPTITYGAGTIVDASGAQMGAIDEVALDNAIPVIVVAATADKGYGYGAAFANNGKIDGIEIMFSEPMNIGKLDQIKIIPGGTDLLVNEFTFTATYTVNDTVEIIDDQNMVIYLNEIAGAGVYDTNIIPDLLYAAVGDSNLTDANGYAALVAITAISTTPLLIETDGAAPVAKIALTIDDDNDGYLDGVKLVFSEAPIIAKDDTAMALAGVTLEEISNIIDLSAATLSVSGDSLTFLGVSLGVGSGNWDTGLLPMAIIADSSGITDAAKNIVVARADSVVAGDTAAPVIGKAIAQTDTKNIVVTFSEAVTDENGNLLTPADFSYFNYAADSTGTISIDTVSASSDSIVWSLVADTILSDPIVTADKIANIAGKVKDFVSITAIVDTVRISDAEVPVLVSAETMDVSNNGMIDTIKLTFSEEIKDSNLSGYNTVASRDTLLAVPISTNFWTVTGYNVLGINLTPSVAAANIVSLELVQAFPNVGDVANDKILYLAITENDVADTDAAPLLTMEGGSFASGVSDYAPNYTAPIYGRQITDNVGPVIMSARMATQTMMEVTFSEELEEFLPRASTTFVWKVGTEQTDYAAAGHILNVQQLEPSILSFEMQNGTNVPVGMASTIEYAAADSLFDVNGNGNVVSIYVPKEVTPPEPVVVESDLPDAFSLSKNFPNPFNPTTTIAYTIPADGVGQVEMVIYNVNGQKVRTLVNEKKEAGYYNVVWDGRNDTGEMVSSGLYLYKIVSGSFNKIEKMTFMK